MNAWPFEFLRYAEVNSIVSDMEIEIEADQAGLVLQVSGQKIQQRVEIIEPESASAFHTYLAEFIQSATPSIGIDEVYARDGEHFALVIRLGGRLWEYTWEGKGDGYETVLPLLREICALAKIEKGPFIPSLSESDLPKTNKERRMLRKKG